MKDEIVINHDAVSRKSLFKAFAASLSGTSLEWYDFAVYGSAAALVFGHLFFPNDDNLTSTLQAFGTYAVGYISRPIGGIVFGRLGDIVGRKKVLVWTLMLIGVATFLIGLLPTYASAGYIAPAMLVLLRFAQGVGVGGEWGGAVLLSSEFSKPDNRGFWASAAQVGPPLGSLLANGVLAILAIALTTEQFNDWGWRVAFLLSAVLVIFGLWIRHTLEETPIFRALEEKNEHSEAPVSEVLKFERRALIAGILSRIGPDVIYACFTVFILSYATQNLNLSRSMAVSCVMIGSALQVFLIPFSGWLSDKIGRRLVYAIGAISAILWCFYFFKVLSQPNFESLLIGVVIALICHSLMYGPQAAFVSEQFTARLRYTGSSLAYTFAGVVGGAVAPLLLTLFFSIDQSAWLICLYMTVACLCTLLGLILAHKTRRDDI